MDFTPDELRRLATPEFSRFAAADPVLRELRQQSLEKPLHVSALFEVLGIGDWRIGKIPVRPLTLAKWAFLWALDSPFVTGKEIGPADLDVMLYVLSVPDLREIPCAPHEIPGEASGLRLASNLTDKECAGEVREMCRRAFLPLEMMPREDPDEAAVYDEVWCAAAGALAARCSGMPLDWCLHNMSLSCVCALYVDHERRERRDGARIRRRPHHFFAAAESRRMEELEKEFVKNGDRLQNST